MKEAFSKAKEAPFTVKVSDAGALESREFGIYTMSSDLMEMEAVFYPPFEGAGMLDEDEIIKDIQHLGVKNGIKTDVVKDFLAHRRYGHRYVIAVGTAATEGSDGYIEYKFNTELKPTPKMNDDGTVDFHTLENVNHIRKGEVVAVLHPEDRGTPGEDLLGRKVMPKKVKHVIFRHGRDLTVSEDGLQLISSVSGHVTLENDKVFVSNVLEIVDVDNSTGDIDYQGNVNIKGNVLAGFSVKATGDIAVSGIVEGATIVAGGNITFNRGVQGMNRAVIKAGGNIVTKFLESVEQVEAGGSIETDSILHSKVNAKGSIKAAGKKGLIIGGEVRSMTLVEAKVIGNELGTATVIGVGVDPAAKRRLDELQKSLQTMGANKIQLNQIITALRKKQDLEGELSQDKKEMLHFIDSVQEALRKRFNGRADIQDKIKERFAAEQEKRKNDVVYLASLSGLEDDVSQWVRYGNSGHGVAIGLNSTILKMTTDTSGVFLQEVFYDTDADQHQITESFEDFFLGKPYCRNWGEENDGEGLFDQLWMNAMAHKHPSFYSENEYRIATLPFGTRRRHDKLGELKMKMLPSGLKECLCLDFQEKCNRIGSSMDQLIDKI